MITSRDMEKAERKRGAYPLHPLNDHSVVNCDPEEEYSNSLFPNYDAQLSSDFSRIANYTAKKSAFNKISDPPNTSLIYAIAAFGASFLRFSRRSTMHGLNHLAQARTAQRRLFWLCITLAASLGFFFNMFFLIEKYVSVPILTNVLHDSDNFMFPDVTFCNVNPIHFPPNGTPEFERMTAKIAEYERFKMGQNEFKDRLALADYLFIQRNTYYVHPKWLTIVECSYMQAPCSSKHFDEKIIWPYGACYTFNASRMPYNFTREISTRTRYNRFRPDLRVIVYKALDYPEGYRLDPHESIQVPPGILLMVHEPDTYPHIGHSGIVDECTQIELKMTSVKHLAKLGKCIPTRPHISYVNAATNESQRFLSSQSDCLDAEVQTALAKFCGCQMHTMPVMYEHHHLPFCLSGLMPRSHIEQCVPMVTEAVDRTHCFLDVCQHFTIDRVIAHTRFPAIEDRHTELHWLNLLAELEFREKKHYGGKSDLARLALLPNSTKQSNLTVADVAKSRDISLLNKQFVNRNFMMLRVVPASLFMDRVEETEEYPFSRLLGDIGGCVGLWIGASLITLFEFVDLILDFFDLGNLGRPQTNQWQNDRNPPTRNNNSNETAPLVNNSGHASIILNLPHSNTILSELSIPVSSPTSTTAMDMKFKSQSSSPASVPNLVVSTDESNCQINHTVIPLFYLAPHEENKNRLSFPERH